VTPDYDDSAQLADRVMAAAAGARHLAIQGRRTKRHYTGDATGAPLDVTTHRGIVGYEPTELVITARGGTPLAEIESALAESGQMLACEPPYFGDGATLGGTLACGLSGPRRPYAGSLRDFVLGTRVINGHGEILKFGGEVMKNVAGFDASRLMVGSLGTLGVILEASLKVLPRPETELTLRFESNAADAIEAMNRWARQPLPLSAAMHSGDSMYVRLSGAEVAVRAARTKIGGETMDKGEQLWLDHREHRRQFFSGELPLWRLSVPPATPPIPLEGSWLIDWGGAQRWLRSQRPADEIEAAGATHGGYARRFSNMLDALSQQCREEPLMHQIRRSFDPHGVFQPAEIS